MSALNENQKADWFHTLGQFGRGIFFCALFVISLIGAWLFAPDVKNISVAQLTLGDVARMWLYVVFVVGTLWVL
jgi:uncharacterized SAM-binding protein YcdF (DUF218 family)